MSNDEVHIVMFPFLAFGHISPFVQLSNKLFFQTRIRITFFSASSNIPRIRSTLNLNPSIEIVPLHFPNHHDTKTVTSTAELPPHLAKNLVHALDLTQTHVRSLLSQLKPHFVFFDFAQNWLPKLASELGIMSVHFSVYSAISDSYITVPSRFARVEVGKTITFEDLMKPPPGYPQSSNLFLGEFEAKDFMFLFKRFVNCYKLSNASMDKKKLKHTGNKPKEQSSMEKKKNDKSKSIHDILPHDLFHRILLRVPIRHLARLRCVSKLWYSLISDPHFAELHFHHSPAATNASVFIDNDTVAHFVYLDSLFTDNNDALQEKKVFPPSDTKSRPDFEVLGSCRGFVLLHRSIMHRFVVWNPLTGSNKLISYSHDFDFKRSGFRLPYKVYLFGFGYDASRDDYLLVVAWQDKHGQYHFNCFSLTTNSRIDFDAALLEPLGFYNWHRGLFFNSAIHWVPSSLKDYRDAILIFDMKERTFSRISGPEQPVTSASTFTGLALLGGCLALYYRYNECTHIWVMKEYKVQSSWTRYKIPCLDIQPLCLSSNMDIVGRRYILCGKVGYFICNVRGDPLKHFKNICCPHPGTHTLYTESLLPLPSDIKDKDNNKKKKKEIAIAIAIGHQGVKQ